MLYKETVEAGTLDLIKELMRDGELTAFNLVGGTALSLKLGHRKSIDIDLFTDSDFDAPHIAKHLSEKYKAENVRTVKNGVFSLINKIKVDILAHQPIDFIGPKIPWQEIASRLREAVADEHKIFQGYQVRLQRQKKLNEQQKLSQRKGRGKRPKL